MAYSSDLARSHSITGVSWIDGVQVKIGDKFLPPKKVTLPLDFQMGNPSEVLFMEYDFSLEERVLQWAEAQRQMKEAQREAEAEQAAGSAPEPEQVSGSAVVAEQAVPNGSALHPVPNGYATVPQPLEPNTASQSVAGQQANPLLNFGSSILTPTPITTTDGMAQTVPSNTASKNSFDLKDFENENDPFESLELKVFNDREELNKMLLGVQGTVSQPHAQGDQQKSGKCDQLSCDNSTPGSGNNEQHQSDQGQVSSSVGGVIESPAPNPRQVAPVQSTGQPPPIPTVQSLKDVDYPSIDSLSLDSILGPSSAVPGMEQNTGPLTTSSYSAVPTHSVSGNYAQSGSALQMQTGNGQVYFSNRPQDASRVAPPGANSSTDRTRLPPLPNSRCLISQAAHSQGMYPTQSSFLNFSADKSKQSGLDFYSRHAVHYVPNGIASHAIEGRPSSGRDSPPLNPLRSARSTPDISGYEERRVSPGLPSSHTPPPYSRPRTGLPPPRPSSQQVDEMHGSDSLESQSYKPLHFVSDHFQTWNPYTVLPPAPSPTPKSNPEAPRNRSHSTSHVGPPPNHAWGSEVTRTAGPPDPYGKLSIESQRFVNNISDMGFPRARVARAVEKLGQDDKQVIDHLCSVTRLSEKGHKEIDAETALHLFDNKEDKAGQYLQLSSQFKELGFSDDKIREALVTSDLDEEKTLDVLTAT